MILRDPYPTTHYSKICVRLRCAIKLGTITMINFMMRKDLYNCLKEILLSDTSLDSELVGELRLNILRFRGQP